MNKLFPFFAAAIMLFSYDTQGQPKRIVSLNGSITGTLAALDLSRNIVAVDVTSVWPEQIKSLPRVSRNRAVSAEGISFFRPDLVIAPAGDLSREVIVQLKSVGIQVVAIRQAYNQAGAPAFIREVANAVDLKQRGEILAKKTSADLTTVLNKVRSSAIKHPKVLFIYARGTGTMSVAGKGSSLDAIIQLAGGKNAIQEFNDFKPYTTEALVKANPDVILLFDSGLSSLGGKEALLRMPGVSFTTAGRNKHIVEMDGSLLTNFSTRLPEAIKELHSKLAGR